MRPDQKKLITVDSRGFVMTSRGRVRAPIITPYKESVDRIWSMLTQDRATVTEHINGRKVPLNVMNFDSDNSVEEKKEITPPAEAPQGDENPEGKAKVVDDITPDNSSVQMRNGDVFSTDPSKVQGHHITADANQEDPENTSGVKDGQTYSTPAEAPQGDENPEGKVENPANQNDQQGNKPGNNNQNNGKNGKHNKGNKGNNNNKGGRAQIFPKTDAKSEEKSEDKKEEKPEESGEQKPAEPTTGKDLAVAPEEV